MSTLQALWGEALGLNAISQATLLVGPSAGDVVDQVLLRLVCVSRDACRECAGCRKALNRTHPDIQRVIKEGKRIKIEQIRELQSDSRYPPLEATHKIYILEGAEDLTQEAANSLLKILEAPPPYLIFLLTAESTNILATILSRCQVIRLSPTSLVGQEEALRSQGLSDDEIHLALGVVAGLPERFDRLMLLVKDGASLKATQSDFETKLQGASALDLIELLGEADNLIEEREAALHLLGQLREMNGFEVLEAAQALSKLPPEKGPLFLEEALRWHRDLLLIKECGHPDGVVFNRDKLGELQVAARMLQTPKITQAIYELERGREVFQGNANLQLFLESLLIKLSE